MKTITDKRDEQRAALEHMGDVLEDAGRWLKRLWSLHNAEFGDDEGYVREGSFTDAGLKRLRGFFAEGKRNMELASFFGVSDSAIAYQRKRWEQLEAARLI